MGLLRDRLNKEREKVNNDFDKETKAPSIKKSLTSSYLNFGQIGKNIPQYFSKEEKQKLDILMWVAGKRHPTKNENDLAWQILVSVHGNIGPMREKVICPYNTFGEPCPICEFIKSNRLSKEVWKMYKENERLIQLIWPHTTPEIERQGIYYWDVAAFAFHEEIKQQAINPEDGGTIQYADPDFGQTFYFNRKEEGSYTNNDGGQSKGVKYSGFKFCPRKSVIPDKIVEEAGTIHLDEALVIMSYEELDELFKQTKQLFGKNETTGATSGAVGASGTQSAGESTQKTYQPSQGKCPASNGVFGKDTNKHPECGDCPIYDDCKAERDISGQSASQSASNESAPSSTGMQQTETSEAEPPKRRLLRRSTEPETDIPM